MCHASMTAWQAIASKWSRSQPGANDHEFVKTTGASVTCADDDLPIHA